MSTTTEAPAHVAPTVVKTNETPGVRASITHARFSASKARQVLNLIRDKDVFEAQDILELCDRDAADSIATLLGSAIANAGNNNDIPPEELFVGACYADEGPTLKRWRPRARGRATQILKRTCHITVIVSRFTPEEMQEIRERAESRGRVTSDARADRARRVAKSREDAKESEEAEDAAAEDTGDADADNTAEDTATDDAAVEDTDAEDSAVEEAVKETAAQDTATEETDEPTEDAAEEATDGAGDSSTEEKN